MAERRSPSFDSDGEDEVDEIEASDDDSNPFEFKIRGAVAPPMAENITLLKLHEMIHDGIIDLCPPYQREPVWPNSRQTKLIDSIYRNIYIPPLVFAVRYCAEIEGDVKVCVDGKQRLTSIMRFMDGTIPFKDSKTGKAWYYTTPESSGSKTRLQIPNEFKEDFNKRTLTCVKYYDLTTTNERQIFQRVQLGVALQAGEKLKAIASPRADWIVELLQRHIEIDNGLPTVIKYDTKRARDFQNVASLAYLCDGIPSDERTPTAVGLESWLESEEVPDLYFKNKVDEALREFRYLAGQPKYNQNIQALQNAKRISPVEFIFIGVLLYRLSHESRSAKAAAICILCQTVRAEYADVRSNSRVCKSLWKYVEHLAEFPTVEIKNKGSAASAGSKARKASNKKRKLDSDEEEGPPVASTSQGRSKKSIGKAGKARS